MIDLDVLKRLYVDARVWAEVHVSEIDFYSIAILNPFWDK